MKITRRDALAATLFGGSMVGLRSLATGLPVKFLLNPKKALAQMGDAGCANMAQAQYVVMCTSYLGDPISCNAPGTYNDPNTNIDLTSLVHPDAGTFPAMAPTPMMLGPKNLPYTAAAVWNTLPPSVLKQTAFCHIMTDTPAPSRRAKRSRSRVRRSRRSRRRRSRRR